LPFMGITACLYAHNHLSISGVVAWEYARH
jgi:hypothetical protein